MTLSELKEIIDELVSKRKDLSREIKILRNRYFARKSKIRE
jgi:hypothetical protein